MRLRVLLAVLALFGAGLLWEADEPRPPSELPVTLARAASAGLAPITPDGSQALPDPAWRAELAIDTAMAQLGKPYRWSAQGPDSFDCSGLMRFAWAAAGIDLPRTSTAQFTELPRVPLEEMQRGDLVFATYGRSIGHVGMYLGDGLMVHAPRTGRHVEVTPLFANTVGAARPVRTT